MCHPPIKIVKSKQNKEKNKAVAKLQKTRDVIEKTNNSIAKHFLMFDLSMPFLRILLKM